MSEPVEAALFSGGDRITEWTRLPHLFSGLNRAVTCVQFRQGSLYAQQGVYSLASEMRVEVKDSGETFLAQSLPPGEWNLIGRVCDQIDRANPGLPIEDCQAIAQDIIRLVREYT